MCTSHLPPATPESSTPDGLDDRIVSSAIGTLELFGVYLGTRLGLYDALAEQESVTAAELAAAAEIDVRYAQEWLEQQAVAAFLDVDVSAADGAERRYSLPSSHRGTLVDPTDAGHVAPLARMVVGIANALDSVVEAYRSGDGVAYELYGADFRHGQGGVNRPAFESDLVHNWMPAVPRVSEVLAAGGRVADVGCGQGYSTTAISAAWPSADVLGVDNDPASVADARNHAANVGSTARFAAIEADALADLGPFDVIAMLECVHDMGHPVDALVAARRALAHDGVLIVADELVADTFTAPGDDLERMMYGWSISHCLPVSRVEDESAAIGTVIRSSTMEALGQAAGFSRVETVDVDGGFFRIYALWP